MPEEDKQQTLAPPVVVALKEEAAGMGTHRVQMERSISQDIREEREDLKEAAEHSFGVIMDLDLDGKVRWVSPSWKDIIGTLPEDVQGKPVSEVLLNNGHQFTETVELMKKDDSRSHIIRFSVRMGPLSTLRAKHSKHTKDEEEEVSPGQSPEPSPEDDEEQTLNLEAQGIMVYDRTTGKESHVCLSSYSPFLLLTLSRRCG